MTCIWAVLRPYRGSQSGGLSGLGPFSVDTLRGADFQAVLLYFSLYCRGYRLGTSNFSTIALNRHVFNVQRSRRSGLPHLGRGPDVWPCNLTSLPTRPRNFITNRHGHLNREHKELVYGAVEHPRVRICAIPFRQGCVASIIVSLVFLTNGVRHHAVTSRPSGIIFAGPYTKCQKDDEQDVLHKVK